MISKASDGSDFLCFLFMYYYWFVNSNSQIIWKIEASTSPRVYPKHLTPLPSRGRGSHDQDLPGGGEFEPQTQFHVAFILCTMLSIATCLQTLVHFPGLQARDHLKCVCDGAFERLFGSREGGNLGVALGVVEASIWPIHNDQFFCSVGRVRSCIDLPATLTS